MNPNTPPPDNENESRNSSAGKWMIVGVWVLLLSLLTLYAQRWLDQRENPNMRPLSGIEGGKLYVELLRNRSGHYVTSGTINGVEVQFMLDTGATSVSIPAAVARRLELDPLYEQQVNTANGSVTVQKVRLESVSVEGLTKLHVDGHINPHMDGNQVLLGMSYLSHFDLVQRAGTLTISIP